MKFNEIQKKAKKMGINTFRMNKTGMIRAIQRAEDNIDCYGSVRVNYCQEWGCLWREDCLALNGTEDQT